MRTQGYVLSFRHTLPPHTHTPIADDEVSHVLLQFKQHHAVSGVAVEGVDDKLVQVYAGGVGVLHAGL